MMGAALYEIAAHETAVVDTARILVLRRSLGDQRCREVIDEVVFHLSDRLGLLQGALERGDIVETRALSGRLASLSEQVGLADFARVCRDLLDCVERGETTATAAVGARLFRLGEDSLFTVMLYADQSAL